MIKFLYKTFLKPFMFLLDPEMVHNGFTAFGELLGSNPVGRKVMDLMYGYHGKDVSKIVDGIKYRTPVILSAGFDYNGNLSQILPSLGFGGEEIGSVTARKCLGNDKPRLIRLPKNKSIIVNKGLKNDGVDEIIKRLKPRQKFQDFVIGVSIAMTNDKDSCEIGSAMDDYYYSLKRLVEENIGDYYTLNISCPNAHWGENFAKPENLIKLLDKISDIKTSKPIYVKMPINLEWEVFNELLKVIVEYKLSGIIVGNLNKNHTELDYPEEAPKEFKGNLSGKPTFERSNNLIKRTKELYGDKLTIIGCGGILTKEDAMTKFELGADLVQLITGMIMEGPHLISEISHEYAKRYGSPNAKVGESIEDSTRLIASN